MFRADAIEAAGIATRTMQNLAKVIPDKGRPGSDARTQLGYVEANALSLCASDTIAPPLDSAFDLVRQTGTSLPQMEGVRQLLVAEIANTVGGRLTRDYSILLSLAQEANIIATMVFASRQSVEQLLASIQQPFGDSEDTAADTMAQMMYQAIVALHAAVVNHLVSTARPLPLMVPYQFNDILPTLIISQRLYADPSRYDEIRQENRVVHPAFCPAFGVALSQ
jgi:prophage DNA circulation protein